MNISSKRSQITLFIILGLVLLLSMGIFIYYTSQQKEQLDLPQIQNQAALQVYVQQCIESVATEVITTVGMQGGMYEPVSYKAFNGENIEYWCYGQGETQCINVVQSENAIADQIIYGIKQEINNCLNLETFEEQGYGVQTEIFQGTAQLLENEVELLITFPVLLEKEEQFIRVDTFAVTVETPLGMLADVARQLINEEATGNPETITFLERYPSLIIKKEKPYPGIVYILQEQGNPFVLQVAVQGVDTIESPGEIPYDTPVQQYGCCYAGDDHACFANTPKTICTEKNGVYEAAPCECVETETVTATQCSDGICNDCGIYAHQESWCMYEESVGEGKDVVGSRHGLSYCFDGVIYEEACRDYREEICVEEEIIKNGNQLTHALCRENRWNDCALCTTESCCENTEQRDCYWNEDLRVLGTENQCVPYVPVGLKFWKYSGLEVCASASTKMVCQGLFCGQETLDAAAVACYSMADCGNYRNGEQEVTEAGFFSSNMRYDPNEEIYEEKGQRAITTLPLEIPHATVLFTSPVQSAVTTALDMLSAVYSFLNAWSDVTVANYLNPFTKDPKLEITEVNLCSIWSAPKKASCDACVEGVFGCSEYRCKSLGKECVYEEKDGFAACRAVEENDHKIFTAALTNLSASYTIEEKELNFEAVSYPGYKIKQPLVPYTLFTMGVTTTEPAICFLDYVPASDVFAPSAFIIGNPAYEKEHILTLRVPVQLEVPGQVKQVLNVTTAQQLVAALQAPEEFLENYEDKFPAVFSVYNTVTGNDLSEELRPFVRKANEFMAEIDDAYPYYENVSLTLTEKFQEGGYYLFVRCEDQYGFSQQNEFFIELDIANETDDSQAPEIVAFVPQNNAFIAAESNTVAVSLYTDEPAECHYAAQDKAFEDMEYAFQCETDPYNFVSVGGGSYECTTTLDAADPEIYIRCADQPENEQKSLFALQSSGTAGVAGQVYSSYLPEEETFDLSQYLNVNESVENKSIITASSYVLSSTETTIFNVTNENITIQFYQDTNDSCIVQNETTTQELTCEKTQVEEEQKGLYRCSTDIFLEINPGNGTETNETSMNESVVYEAYTIACKTENVKQNVATSSTYYSLSKTAPLEIVSISPEDNEEVTFPLVLSVTTTGEEVVCGYGSDDEFYAMEEVTENGFIATIEKEYAEMSIHCEDIYGNSIEKRVEWYSIE